jgi:hypothetical protein
MFLAGGSWIPEQIARTASNGVLRSFFLHSEAIENGRFNVPYREWVRLCPILMFTFNLVSGRSLPGKFKPDHTILFYMLSLQIQSLKSYFRIICLTCRIVVQSECCDKGTGSQTISFTSRLI